jgi:prepilin-type processing-associated H-X9-DG protein
MTLRPLLVILAVGSAGFGLYRVTEPFRVAGTTRSCQTNLKQIGLSMMQYVRDYDEKYPPASRWAQVLGPYHKRGHGISAGFTCPTEQAGYVYNQYFSYRGRLDWHKAATAPLAFDSTRRGFNLYDKGTSWPQAPIHRQFSKSGNNVLFQDGHVELLSQKPIFKTLPTVSEPLPIWGPPLTTKQNKPKPPKTSKLSP